VQDDIRAIEALVARQFASLNWTPGTSIDGDAFAGDFFPGATLYPAARPAKPQTVEAFIQRMRSLAENGLRSFHETLLGTEIHVFGNVAVALAACEMTENGDARSRSVEMLLLIKSEGNWRIVAQAWDSETPSKPIPAGLRKRP
jgi:hypothetical protein